MTYENSDNLFTFKNGRTIDDPHISAKMEIIMSRRPEKGSIHYGNGYSWDECGMAELFAECYQEDTRYCPENKTWYTYSAGAWRKDVGSLLVSAKIKEFYGLLALYSGEVYDKDDETSCGFYNFVGKLGNRNLRDRMLKDASDNELLVVPAKMFDNNPYLINCLNGTYDLKEMCFREHDWRDFLTKTTNFEYTIMNPRCERWETFIGEVTEGDKEKATYLQKALGYSMLGLANEECMFLLHGKTTRNGKSTLLSAIQHMLGEYAGVAPASIICKSDRVKNAESASPVLASLKGQRFVTMAESDQYGKLDEEVIKQLTGGEEITTRALYERPTTWLPQFTLWLSCNDLPTVRDKSLFASDRLRVIEFNRHFSAKEQDKSLKTLFQTEDAMEGIFTWLLEGYAEYKRTGLEMPESIQGVVDAYQRDNDLVLQFLDDKCKHTDPKQKQFTRAKSLYDSFKIWCKSNGYFVASAKTFYAGLDTHPEWHGGSCKRDGYAVYRDIALRQ